MKAKTPTATTASKASGKTVDGYVARLEGWQAEVVSLLRHILEFRFRSSCLAGSHAVRSALPAKRVSYEVVTAGSRCALAQNGRRNSAVGRAFFALPATG